MSKAWFYALPKWAQALVVVVVAGSIDALWILWIRSVAHSHIIYASVLSSVIGAVSLFGVTTVIEKKWTYPYWILGLGVGTALAMLAKLH